MEKSPNIELLASRLRNSQKLARVLLVAMSIVVIPAIFIYALVAFDGAKQNIERKNAIQLTSAEAGNSKPLNAVISASTALTLFLLFMAKGAFLTILFVLEASCLVFWLVPDYQTALLLGLAEEHQRRTVNSA